MYIVTTAIAAGDTNTCTLNSVIPYEIHQSQLSIPVALETSSRSRAQPNIRWFIMLSAYAMQLVISHSVVTAVVSDYQLVYLHQFNSDPVTMQTELICCRSMLFIVWSTVVVRLPCAICSNINSSLVTTCNHH